MAMAPEPEIVQERDPDVIEFELEGRHTRGQTIVVPPRLADRDPNVLLVRHVDRSRLEVLVASVARTED